MAKTKRQLAVPGTEPKSIKELDAAAEAYVDARDERIARTEKETDARELLITVMRKHKLDIYRDDEASPPLLVTLVEGEAKVKVARIDESDEV